MTNDFYCDIRAATPADADAIARVHVQSWREAYTGIIPDAVLERMSVERRAQKWRSGMERDDSRTLVHVAESSGGIIGFVAAGPERDGIEGYAGPTGGEIYALYVLRMHHRHGIGRQLMQTAAQRLHDERFQTLLLWVLALNPARNFYEPMGGVSITEKEIEIGGATLREIAYGWPDLAAWLQIQR